MEMEEEQIEELPDEYVEEVEEIVNEYQEVCDGFEEDINDILERLNESDLYKELGIELNISFEYLYSMEER